MSIGHNPKIVRDGLVLALDAANTKSSLSAIEVLIVGGGGGGGFGHGGGGAGGSVLYNAGVAISPATSYNIVVGLGGIGNQNNASNNSGESSTAFGVTATGGGSGSNESGNDSSGRNGVGGNGANGGGGTYNFKAGGIGSKPTAPAGWNVFGGNNGGTGGSTGNANYPTGGGAGAGGAGGDATPGTTGGAAGGQGQTAGSGGPGVLIPILGVNYYWGGGGGGVTYNTGGIPGDGGIGGGGGGSSQLGSVVGQGGGSSLNVGSNGNLNADVAGGNAGANTGGGGGGGANENGVGGNGGSGIVIVRYKGSQRASGGTVTFVNGYTIHTFTTSGTFTPNGTPGTGTIWTDFSKNGNSGIITNGVGYNSANGGSFVFDGMDDYISIAKTSQFNFGTSDFAIETFCNLTSKSTSYPCIFANYSAYGTGAIYFGYDHSSVSSKYSIHANGTVVLSSSSNVTYNIWTYLTLVRSAGILYFYINGVLNGTPVNMSSSLNGSGSLITIGKANDGSSAFTHGKIANFKVYNRSLTAAEIKQNFNALRGRFGI